MGEFARRNGWCAISPQEPSAHQSGNFSASSLNGSLSANCKRVMPADFVILATRFDTLRSIFSLCVANTSLAQLPTGPAPVDAPATTNEEADVKSVVSSHCGSAEPRACSESSSMPMVRHFANGFATVAARSASLILTLRLRTLPASSVIASVARVLMICMEATVSSKTRVASCKTSRHARA